jgi:hypothetical protein
MRKRAPFSWDENDVRILLSLLTARPVFSLKAFFATVVETKSQGTSA